MIMTMAIAGLSSASLIQASAAMSSDANVFPEQRQPVLTAPRSLPPIAEHAVDPHILPTGAAHGGGSAMTQTIQLTVVGGPLELVTPNATVELSRVDSAGTEWVGVLPPVQVIDARGTHAGWTVRWFVDSVEVPGARRSSVPDAQVVLDPAAPAVVAGTADGLSSGETGRGRPSGRALFGAAPGSGGGTYEAGAMVSVRLPHPVDAEQVVVRLALSVT
jgi:hypothetical protein